MYTQYTYVLYYSKLLSPQLVMIIVCPCNTEPPDRSQASLSVHCLDVSLPYAYELLGCQPYPIFTPRALNCSVVFLQSLSQYCGSEVSGPVESGKTRLVKGVGMLCGRNVIVTQCSQLTDPAVVLSIMEGCSQVSKGASGGV